MVRSVFDAFALLGIEQGRAQCSVSAPSSRITIAVRPIGPISSSVKNAIAKQRNGYRVQNRPEYERCSKQEVEYEGNSRDENPWQEVRKVIEKVRLDIGAERDDAEDADGRVDWASKDK